MLGIGDWSQSFQLLGYIVGFVGISIGFLWVFADRHGYERPGSRQIVLVLLGLSATLLILSWILQLLA